MSNPRLFINMHYMALGGAERALLGLLNALDPERVDVDLFLNQHTGEFMPLIPEHVNLLPERRGYNAIERPMKTIFKERQYGIILGRLKARWQHSNYHRSLPEPQRLFDSSVFQYVFSAVDSYLPPLNEFGKYDLAISFMQPHNIVLNKVNAHKKIAWIHQDYATIHINTKLELPIWEGFDNIISISPDCTLSFVKAFPSLENKIIEIENILSPSFVRQQSELFNVSDEMPPSQGLKLLSIGRFCHQKNFDNIPDIMRCIVKEYGIAGARWYLVGFGGGERLIREKIAEAGMEENVIILGKKDNPYPYIKACDVYVQPSRYEGKSVTVREAQILCKPVIITNYATASSQVKDGVDGIIIPMDNAGCARGIVDAIHQQKLLDSISSYLLKHDYGNESEVEKVYQLVDGCEG